MVKPTSWLALTLGAGLSILTVVDARQTPANGTLTAQDREEIQAVVTGYARALGTCVAEQYADLFAPDSGYFFSAIRGEVAGRDKLMALVRSERQCTAAEIGRAHV